MNENPNIMKSRKVYIVSLGIQIVLVSESLSVVYSYLLTSTPVVVRKSLKSYSQIARIINKVNEYNVILPDMPVYSIRRYNVVNNVDFFCNK